VPRFRAHSYQAVEALLFLYICWSKHDAGRRYQTFPNAGLNKVTPVDSAAVVHDAVERPTFSELFGTAQTLFFIMFNRSGRTQSFGTSQTFPGTVLNSAVDT
jgi:hypothetical protein